MTRTERRMRPRYEQAQPVGFGWRDLGSLSGDFLGAIIVILLPVALCVFAAAASYHR